MEMNEVYSNDKYKVLSVTLNRGECMPKHHATSDAFLIGKKGRGKISFTDRQVILSQGETLLIKANEIHQLDILEDFGACIVLDSEGEIKFGQ